MKSIKIELNVDPEMFKATQQFMEEKGVTIEIELSDSVAKFYKKYVPADVRKYIERNASPTHATREKTSNTASNGLGETGSPEPVSPSNPEKFLPTAF